jgi:flagellar biosynthesis protein FliP
VAVVTGILLPVLAVTATAFAKISVVLGALRGGLGLPEVLPAPVLTGLAALLAAVVMLPTARSAVEAAGGFEPSAAGYADAAERAWPVWEAFLVRETRAEDLATVRAATAKLEPARAPDASPSPPERVLAFLISELGAAFQMALAVLLPFLIIDLLTSHTLAVVGFHLLSPAVVALPFKLLLFVAVGGWGLMVRGLLSSYG